jgi:hypothetical protein
MFVFPASFYFDAKNTELIKLAPITTRLYFFILVHHRLSLACAYSTPGSEIFYGTIFGEYRFFVW